MSRRDLVDKIGIRVVCINVTNKELWSYTVVTQVSLINSKFYKSILIVRFQLTEALSYTRFTIVMAFVTFSKSIVQWKIYLIS